MKIGHFEVYYEISPDKMGPTGKSALNITC